MPTRRQLTPAGPKKVIIPPVLPLHTASPFSPSLPNLRHFKINPVSWQNGVHYSHLPVMCIADNSSRM